MSPLMLLELSHWFTEVSLREGLFLSFRRVLIWGRDFGMVEGVLLLDKLLVLFGTGGRPALGALTTEKIPGPDGAAGPMSSVGDNEGPGVRGRLDLMYADTTVRSTLLPVSTSVSSAPTRVSTLSRKGGRREDVREREWLL